MAVALNSRRRVVCSRIVAKPEGVGVYKLRIDRYPFPETAQFFNFFIGISMMGVVGSDGGAQVCALASGETRSRQDVTREVNRREEWRYPRCGDMGKWGARK